MTLGEQMGEEHPIISEDSYSFKQRLESFNFPPLKEPLPDEPENNQEIKADAGKPRLTLVPPEIIKDIAYIRMYGVKKYGKKECWRNVEIERYRDAMFRHMLAYLDDPQGVDEESGYPHLWHLACNVAFLCELEKEQKGNK